jgi:hypothetical protein
LNNAFVFLEEDLVLTNSARIVPTNSTAELGETACLATTTRWLFQVWARISVYFPKNRNKKVIFQEIDD